MAAKDTLALLKRVYFLIDRFPHEFCPEDGATYPDKVKGCESLGGRSGNPDLWV